MKKQQAAPEYTTDADGQRLAHVALANSNQRATLYVEDYRRLMDAGFSRHWQYTEDGRGSAYVTLCAYTREGRGRMIPVARLLADAGNGERVRCNDGNTLNLRSENLTTYPGRAWFAASDWFPTTDALRAAGITPAANAAPRRRRKRRSTPLETMENSRHPTALRTTGQATNAPQ
ncbi:hypothetical protein [Rhodanobacter soli]|uniref:hypothetical protein n=1 Tax=Rhodanobacter soli TaxID=590609 RepID=UPI0031DB37BC